MATKPASGDGDAASEDATLHTSIPTPPPTETPSELPGDVNPTPTSDDAEEKPVGPTPPESSRDEGEESDSGSESSSSSSDDSDHVEQASRLTTSRLHEAYLKRLENQKGKRTNGERGPAMVRGMVDYMKMLEDRIEALESERGLKQEEEKGADEQKDADQQHELGSLVHEVKFFHSRGEFLPDGNWNDNVLKKGSFQSKLDPNHLMRVLYDWADDSSPQNRNKDDPDPNDIDILAFGIMSQPMAAFFTKRLGIEVEEGEGHPLRFGKPFRPFLRNYQAIKDHYGKLEKKYRQVRRYTTIISFLTVH